MSVPGPFRLLFVALSMVFALCAQDGFKYPIPEKLERATAKDDKGVEQWVAFEPTKCQACSGTGKVKCPTCERYPEEATKCVDCNRSKERMAVCHTCAGTGQTVDPLAKAICPGCQGAGGVVCGFCPGSGILTLGEDKRWSNCLGCRGRGFEKCAVCNGQRLVECAAVKPTLKDANAAALGKALVATEDALKGLGTFAALGKNTRKEQKELARLVGLSQQIYPPLKRTLPVLDSLMATVAASDDYQGLTEREVAAMGRIKAGVEYYLKHQKRMIELAKKRADANEALAAENKGK